MDMNAVRISAPWSIGAALATASKSESPPDRLLVRGVVGLETHLLRRHALLERDHHAVGDRLLRRERRLRLCVRALLELAADRDHALGVVLLAVRAADGEPAAGPGTSRDLRVAVVLVFDVDVVGNAA